jgi:hypothetical protein
MTSIEKLETNPFPPGIMLDTDPRYDFVRETVSEMYHTAQQRALDKSIPSEFVNDSIAQLRRVPGITLLEMRDFRSDFDFRCAEYTFGGVYNEEWAQQGWTVNTVPEFWDNPREFLNSKGFQFITKPKKGDIVAYGDFREDGSLRLEHFGLYAGDSYIGDQHVISKFGQGPIMHHDINIISSHPDAEYGNWGDRVWFLEKQYPEDLYGAVRIPSQHS